MKNFMAWIGEKVFHKKKDKLLFEKIEAHQELIKKADDATSKLKQAVLDGEIDWFYKINQKHSEKERRKDNCAKFSDLQHY